MDKEQAATIVQKKTLTRTKKVKDKASILQHFSYIENLEALQPAKGSFRRVKMA